MFFPSSSPLLVLLALQIDVGGDHGGVDCRLTYYKRIREKNPKGKA